MLDKTEGVKTKLVLGSKEGLWSKGFGPILEMPSPTMLRSSIPGLSSPQRKDITSLKSITVFRPRPRLRSRGS